MNIYIFRIPRNLRLLGLSLVLGSQMPATAQEVRPVTLQEAIAAATAQGPGIAEAIARAEAARHAERGARAALLPQVTGEIGGMRSNDPVAAFGSRLRQGRFTQADFDPALLNDPDARIRIEYKIYPVVAKRMTDEGAIRRAYRIAREQADEKTPVTLPLGYELYHLKSKRG